jgi:hypothetical protein
MRVVPWQAMPLGALVLALASGALAAQAESPRTFLSDIYTHYTDEAAPVLAWNSEDAAALFEPGLAAAIARDSDLAGQRGEVSPILDYDPFVQGQDYEIKGLTVSVEEAAPRTATVLVKFRNREKPVAIRYDLVRLEDGWRIRDMRWGGTSLRALYRVR